MLEKEVQTTETSLRRRAGIGRIEYFLPGITSSNPEQDLTTSANKE